MRSEHVAEVEQLRGRLAAARQSFDNAAIIGTAKELVECSAKIAMTERAVTFSDSTRAPEIVDKALRALDLPSRLTDPARRSLAGW